MRPSIIHLPLMETPSRRFPLLRQSSNNKKQQKTMKPKDNEGGAGGMILRTLRILPMLAFGCKMSRLRCPGTTTVTLFGHRRGRVTLAIQEDPSSLPTFLIELPIITAAVHKEMGSGPVKLALECQTRSAADRRRQLVEEYVWAVYCNGRKIGYSVRKRQAAAVAGDGWNVVEMLRGVSVGAGIMSCSPEQAAVEGEMTYMRARFERVVGSKDSEALHMINQDGKCGPELSIFLVRVE